MPPAGFRRAGAEMVKLRLARGIMETKALEKEKTGRIKTKLFLLEGYVAQHVISELHQLPQFETLVFMIPAYLVLCIHGGSDITKKMRYSMEKPPTHIWTSQFHGVNRMIGSCFFWYLSSFHETSAHQLIIMAGWPCMLVLANWSQAPASQIWQFTAKKKTTTYF